MEEFSTMTTGQWENIISLFHNYGAALCLNKSKMKIGEHQDSKAQASSFKTPIEKKLSRLLRKDFPIFITQKKQ